MYVYIRICIYMYMRDANPIEQPVRGMIHSHTWHDSFTYVTWLIHVRDMTHSHTRYDLFDMTHLYGPWLIYMGHDTLTHSHALYDLFTYATWLIHILDMTHLYGPWLIYMGHESFTTQRCNASNLWLIHICYMTHWHGPWLIYDTELWCKESVRFESDWKTHACRLLSCFSGVCACMSVSVSVSVGVGVSVGACMHACVCV